MLQGFDDFRVVIDHHETFFKLLEDPDEFVAAFLVAEQHELVRLGDLSTSDIGLAALKQAPSIFPARRRSSSLKVTR